MVEADDITPAINDNMKSLTYFLFPGNIRYIFLLKTIILFLLINYNQSFQMIECNMYLIVETLLPYYASLVADQHIILFQRQIKRVIGNEDSPMK